MNITFYLFKVLIYRLLGISVIENSLKKYYLKTNKYTLLQFTNSIFAAFARNKKVPYF